MSSLDHVTLSIQQATYFALPILIAQELGYFEALNLNVTVVAYTSGAPQVIDAIENNAWDIGAAGVVPNIVGGARGILNIGISNDETATNLLIGKAEAVAEWPLDSIEGVTFAVTPNSTGEYAARACIEAEGFSVPDMELIYAEQNEMRGILRNKVADYGAFWAPFSSVFLAENPGSAALCSGETAGVTITGGIMTRSDFASEKPELVDRVLAAWLRSIAFMKKAENLDTVIDYMTQFYASFGVSVSRFSMINEIDIRPVFDLNEQLALMRREPGDKTVSTRNNVPNVPSQYDNSTAAVADFLFRNGVLTSETDVTSFITDQFLRSIEANETLRAFALLEEVGGPSSAPPNVVWSWWYTRSTLGVVISSVMIHLLLY